MRMHFTMILVGLAMLKLSPLLAAAPLKVPEDFSSIQEAIDAAKSGDVVLVAAGKYPGPVKLKPGIVVRSVGDDKKGELGLVRAETTIIDGGKKPNTGVLMAEGSVLDGFTVTNVGEYDDALWNKHHATRGNEQGHEHIGGFGSPGIGADGVNCTIKNNIVHHIGHTGIAIQGAEGKIVAPVVTNNVTYRNMGGGIGAMAGVSGVVSGNKCFENFYAGIGHEGGSPLVEGNECFENIRAGIGISEGACPIVRKNNCYKNRRAGIGTRTGADTKPIIENNECYQNGMAGIGTDEGAAPLIRGNHCYENEMAGIGSRHDAKPTIIGNKVLRNRAAGIGFEACEHGIALVHGNTVEENGKVAIGVQSGWQVVVSSNRLITGEGLPPVAMVFEGAEAVFSNNLISGSGVAGIRVAGEVRANGNRFEGKALRKVGPPNFAVWALEGSKVSLSGNRMKKWRHALSASGAEVQVVGNRAEDFHQTAFVVAAPSARSLLTGNVAVSDQTGAKAVSLRDDSHGSIDEGNELIKP